MTLASTENGNVTLTATVGSQWEQKYPEILRGVRVTVTAVKVVDGVVWVESEESAFPGARVWLELPRWVDFFHRIA
jgi:hypothetical protein